MFFKTNVLYHIGRNQSTIKEGGLARDNAIYENLKNYTNFIQIKKSKILNVISVFSLFLFSKNNRILIHYPLLVGIPLSDKYFFLKYLRKLFIILFLFAQNRNKFFIDTSDLPIEQAKDLDLTIPSYYQEIEAHIFNNKSKYFFASSSMKDFVVEKYNLSDSNTKVWINGGNSVDKIDIKEELFFLKEQKINYVYAGTLNKGRQIEYMLDLFSKLENKNLILMGSEGEWIRDIKLPEHIIFLGSLDEKYAHYIVSLCDVGLIPYDSSRMYYNIAYPTKLSFYITAGISYLSTNVKEVSKINNKYSLGYVGNIEDWEKLISLITKDDLVNKKELIKDIRADFLWSNIVDINDLK